MAQVQHRPSPAQSINSHSRSPLELRDHNLGSDNQSITSFKSTASSLRPTIRMQGAPVSPVSISPPRSDLRQPSSATMGGTYSPPDSRANSRQSSARDLHTPDFAALRDSIGNMSLNDRPGSVASSHGRVPSRMSVKSSSSSQRLQDLPENDTTDQVPQLQYAHQPYTDSPAKKAQRVVSQGTIQSTGSVASSVGDSSAHLRPPQGSGPNSRPASTNSMSDSRGRLRPQVSQDELRSSPRSFSRGVSSHRSTPDSRPMSYIDLLNEIPYHQQVAPVPVLNNSALQSAVGNNASLLDTKKTLDMYRANVKKTNDPSIQYEFAIFMVNAAKDAMMTGSGIGTGGETEAKELVKEARDILQKLSDRGYPFAQYYLADGFFSGFFNKDKPDHDKAFPLFVAASKHGHAESSFRAALCYEFGWGTGKAPVKAAQYYRTAASKGHPGAAVRLGKACLTGDLGLGVRAREGAKWLKRATEGADTQYNAGPYEFGLLHIAGYGDDIFKDEAYAAQLLTQSAELGHVDANFRMGQAYELGLLGCPRDTALSVHFYNGAAQRGHPDAMMALCAWYMVGAEPILEKDEAEAYEWAKKAAELGLPKAEYAVGYFTEMGIGCRRDPLEANVWYVRAADNGNETAHQRLAIIRAAASGDSGIPMTKSEARSKELGGKGGWMFWKGSK